jgi:uncharacterized membrane protein
MDQADMTEGETQAAPSQPPRKQIAALAPTLVFDVAGPLIVYYALKADGMSNVSALVLSGILPALRVVGGVLRHRRLDPVGALVLLGIAVGSIVGVASHNARLVLLEGVVPTAVFGLACLGSLATSRPLMFRLALTFVGPQTARGREFASLWRWESFRHVFRVVTVVWGLAYIAESAVKAVIIESMSISSAKAVTQVLPYVVLCPLIAWNLVYGKRRQAEGERMAARAAAQQAA